MLRPDCLVSWKNLSSRFLAVNSFINQQFAVHFNALVMHVLVSHGKVTAEEAYVNELTTHNRETLQTFYSS